MVVKLNKNFKKEFFDNLEIKNNSKSFSDKCKPTNNLSLFDHFVKLALKGLIGKDQLLLKNKKVADVINFYFQSITDSLDLFECPLGSTDQLFHNADRIIDSSHFYPSIKNI